MTPWTLWLMRHGEPVMTGRMLGRSDVAVTAAGIAACRAQAADLRFDTLISSDLARARDCAAAIGAVTVDPRWRELDFGEWDGLPAAALDETALGAFWRDPDGCPPPGGERWSALIARVGAAIAELAPQPTLVVTHGGAMRAALAVLCGLDVAATAAFALPYATVLALTVWPGAPRTAQVAGTMAVRALIAALGFLTRLPVPRLAARPGDFAAAVRLYPLAGLAVGLVVAGAGWAGTRMEPWVGAAAALAGWVWVTGALHLDGLADVADGLGAAHGAPQHNRARLLAVMAEPQVGSFGVVAIVMQMLAKLVLLHAVLPVHWPALIAIPAAARLGPLVWARALPPLRPGGLGASIAGAVRKRDLIGWLAVLAGVAVLIPPLAVTPLLIAAVLLWLQRRLGGVTGDAHGAGIELIETGLLLVVTLTA